MKKIKFLVALIILTCCISLSSCGTMNLGSKLKNVEIGMTKKEVTSILGNNYSVVTARQTPEGALEVLRYVSPFEGIYIVTILDGKLVEWYHQSANEL